MFTIPKVSLTGLSPVEIYQMVRKGDKIKKFPNGYWQQEPEATQNAIEITRYLFEEVLGLNQETIKDGGINADTFKSRQLTGMLKYVFDYSPYKAINVVYPNVYTPWELNLTPLNYWNKETARKALKWLFEIKLNWTPDDIRKNLSIKTFQDYNLEGMVSTMYHHSPIEAVMDIYPHEFRVWEFQNVPLNFWEKSSRIKVVKWLIEEELKWNRNDILVKWDAQLLKDYGLSTILNKHGVFSLLDEAYPSSFQPWQIKNCPSNYWTKETGRKAVRWLIEKQLKWSKEDIKERLTTDTFINNDLAGMLSIVYDNSVYKALEDTFPGLLKPWELKQSPMYYWNKDTAKEAIHWLFDEQLKWNEQEIVKNARQHHFIQYGILSAAKEFSSYKEAIKYAYGDIYHKYNDSVTEDNVIT